MGGRGLFWAREAEQMRRHFADLDLLRAFGDAITAVVAIDVLERLVAGITDATVHLDCQIRRLAAEPVAAVVRHRHPIGYLEAVLAVEVPGGLVDKVAHYLAFRMQLGKRPLDRLVRRQLLADHRTGAGVFDALVDAVLRDADARGALADTVLLDEILGDAEA